MYVPFIDLSPTIKKVQSNVLSRWESCLERGEFVGGKTVEQLEMRLKEQLGVTNFISCSSGTDALIVGLQAMGIKQGMRVALTNLTFWAPYEAIVQLGATPILIDIDPNDLQMSYDAFEEAYEKYRFDGAILVHMYGWTSGKLSEFRQFCKQKAIPLLEDGAQSYGVLVNGESVYQGAEIGTISFYPAKVFGGSGDGGGITTFDPKFGSVQLLLLET